MTIKDLPRSLIDSVLEVMSKSHVEREKMSQRLMQEGLRKFGVKRISQLSETDARALDSWVQIKIHEAFCVTCSEAAGQCHCDHIEEDDMPNDSVYHKDGEESGEKKKELDEEESAADVVTSELEKMGKTLGELSPEEKKALFNKVDSLVKAKDEEVEEVSEEDEIDIKNVKEDVDFDWECVDCDTRGNRKSDKNQDKSSRDMRYQEYLGLKKLSFLSKEQKRRLEVLKTLRVKDNKKAMSESVAISPEELAVNGAIGNVDNESSMPIQADVILDSDPITGKRQLRLLVQFPTSNMLTIVPPPSLPGAPTIDDLRMVVEGLPYFGEVIDRALRNAVDLPSNEPRFGGNGLSESKNKAK